MRGKLILLGSLLIAGCATTPGPATSDSPENPVPVAHNNMNSVLWVQTAAEYEGNTLTVYSAASQQLASLQSQSGVTADLDQAAAYGCVAGVHCDALAAAGLIPAVVLDVDETVLDNSPYQAALVVGDTSFDPVGWDAWIAERSAAAVPGAVSFIEAAQAAGVAVIYMTNRACGQREGSQEDCPQRSDTLENLKLAGFPSPGENDLLILRGERPGWDTSEKQSRRAFVAERYRMIMLIGDDIGDLASGIKADSPGERAAFVKAHESLYGVHWFQLANPTYGSWIRSLGRGAPGDHLRPN